MSAFMVFYALLFGLGPLAIVAGIIYLIVRRRNGHPGVTAYHTLVTYFYAVMGVSVLICALGLGFLVNLGFGRLYSSGVEAGSSITTGFTLLAIGVLILLLHYWGLRLVARRGDQGTRTLKRIYLFIMLAFFSITGLISVPLAVAYGTRYSPGEAYGYETPETFLTVALIVVLLWIYFFWRVVRELRAPKPAAEAENV